METAAILIVYHSQTGNTEKMALAAAEGVAAMDDARVVLKRAAEAGLADLLSCQGLILATPEYFGYMAGAVKDFLDRTYEPARGRKEVFKKPYAVLVSAGNDGQGALTAVERIALGYPFKKVLAPIVAKGLITEENLDACRELGQTMAAGCLAGIY
ncbi:MAG: NAD(P)H-dependent oxidoreductase [Pseudomonadota bacterium]